MGAFWSYLSHLVVLHLQIGVTVLPFSILDLILRFILPLALLLILWRIFRNSGEIQLPTQ